MRPIALAWYLCLGLLSLPICSCSDESIDKGEPALPAWLTEEDPQDNAESVVPAEHLTSAAPKQERASLELSLHPGEQFPMRKVVQQELQQASLNGVPQISRSELELLLTIAVEAVQGDTKRLSVRYDRVRYSHEVAGETVAYDSAAPPTPVPEAALAYHGMVQHGFAFDLGADNQIAGVLGFREFLEGCLQHVPAEQRGRVMLEIEANAGESGIADFLDNSIGLLPPDVAKGVGDSWERLQHISRPVPMQLSTVYTLTGLNEEFAEINVTGAVSASTPLGQSAPDEERVRIVVEGGQCRGRCTLFRASGLPKQSQVERVVDMTVHLEGGLQFAQQKRTVTTVESYAAQPGAPATSAAAAAATRFQ